MQVRAKIADTTNEWEEELTVPSLEEAETVLLELLDTFNRVEEIRYGKKARKRWLVGIVGTASDVHDWVKQTVIYSGKIEYICSRCHLSRKFDYTSLSRPGTQEKCYPERVCRVCNKQFASKENYDRHYKRKHEGK